MSNGGPIAKELIPKLTVVRRNLSSKLGVAILDINVQPVITSTILLMRVGGILFVLGSTFGSYLLEREILRLKVVIGPYPLMMIVE
ncbi:hypothetical protein glysoja_005041 [Glycine soja]|nr:hypothetical protein glysoja_005041 [Glycine soja]